MESNQTPEQQIDAFWEALWNSWEIEPRSYFEEKAPRNGFGSPLAMAVHYMWKREVKLKDEAVSKQVELAKIEGARVEREATRVIVQTLINAARNEVVEADVTNEKTDWAYNRGITDAVNAMLAECVARGLKVG